MSVHFKSIKYKNFLSCGNSFIEILLDKSPTTLITGHNGSGKTTILEALVYCLYGKPYRKVKVGNLVNNINKRNLVTECCFEFQEDEYRIIRGQKPNIFEIYKNDKLVDQNSNSKDYQQNINKILGDYKIFTQTVILNKSKFIPFLSTSLMDRRIFVDNMLDINVFTYMSNITKKIQSELKNKIYDLEYKKESVEGKISLTESTINDLKTSDDSFIKDIEMEISNLSTEINNKEIIFNEKKSVLEKEESPINEINYINSKINNLKFKGKNFVMDIQNIKNKIKFYENNDICPTCNHNLEVNDKLNEIEKFKEEINNCLSSLNELKSNIENLESERGMLNDRLSKYEKNVSELKSIETELFVLNKQKLSKENVLLQIKSKEKEQINKQENVLLDLQKKLENNRKMLKECIRNKEIVDILFLSLKDDGVKTKIINTYIPILNEKINQYLEDMEFYIGVELDENFNEVFTAPGREGFSYNNLSDGQKSRLDLSILLSWLYIAELKSSLHTNLLFLDEILSAVDYEGINCFMNLIRVNFSNKNLFVIEQRQDLNDKFRNNINFKLVEGFTEIN